MQFLVQINIMLTASQRTSNWRRSIKERIVTAMGSKCQICSYNKCNSALEFHHLDPSIKEFSFGKIIANPIRISSILNELEKCILLCSNCHREVHSGITDLPKSFHKLDRSLFEKTPPKMDNCPVCNSQKLTTKSTCSNICASKLRRKVNWDEYNLIDLVEVQKIPMVKLAKQFGVSDNAVKKQYKKQLQISSAPRAGIEPA